MPAPRPTKKQAVACADAARARSRRCSVVPIVGSNASNRRCSASLADAERREDLAEQIVARELARELAEHGLRVAQVLGCELERRLELRTRGTEVLARARQ